MFELSSPAVSFTGIPPELNPLLPTSEPIVLANPSKSEKTDDFQRCFLSVFLDVLRPEEPAAIRIKLPALPSGCQELNNVLDPDR